MLAPWTLLSTSIWRSQRLDIGLAILSLGKVWSVYTYKKCIKHRLIKWYYVYGMSKNLGLLDYICRTIEVGIWIIPKEMSVCDMIPYMEYFLHNNRTSTYPLVFYFRVLFLFISVIVKLLRNWYVFVFALYESTYKNIWGTSVCNAYIYIYIYIHNTK